MFLRGYTMVWIGVSLFSAVGFAQPNYALEQYKANLRRALAEIEEREKQREKDQALKALNKVDNLEQRLHAVDFAEVPGAFIGSLGLAHPPECSAALVGKKHIVTAGHCARRDTTYFSFRQTAAHLTPKWTERVKATLVASGSRDEADYADDFAIYELAEAIGGEYGFLEVENHLPAKGDRITAAGYLRPTHPRQASNCRVTDRETHYFMADCEGLGPGTSGGPVVRKHDGKYYLVGIISGPADVRRQEGLRVLSSTRFYDEWKKLTR